MVTNIKRVKGSPTIATPSKLYDARYEEEFSLVMFQSGSKVPEAELNLGQQLSNYQLRKSLTGLLGDGGLLTDLAPVGTGVDNEIRLHTENKKFYISFDGIVKTVYAFDNPVNTGTKSRGGNRVTLPSYAASPRIDLVYLELWFEEIQNASSSGSATSDVLDHGMDHGFTVTNNLFNNSAGEETARRVQLRGKIRTLQGITLPVSMSTVSAKDVVGYNYTNTDNNWFWTAGSGDLSSATALNSVDGYVYACPLVYVNRDASAVTDDDIHIIPDIISVNSLASKVSDLEARLIAIEKVIQNESSNDNPDAVVLPVGPDKWGE